MRISFLLLTLAIGSAEAQSRRPPAVYFEFAGEGLGLSANLDVGVTQSLRLRGGVGWLWTMGTIPVTMSYLTSHQNLTFEAGVGSTLVVFLPDNTPDHHPINEFIEDHLFGLGHKPLLIMTGLLGLRYHPPDGAVIRLTVTPLMHAGQAIVVGGASLGFTF